LLAVQGFLIHVVVGSLMREYLREQLVVEVDPGLDMFLATMLMTGECDQRSNEDSLTDPMMDV